ncbi:hypothetical protein IFM89_011359 [Coptis chinensis]|uniref:Phototropic-responsive NPH3 family protein n=1 Tax=Coptis chinensis TaxID=261450 RepID=A0A835HPG6_9MAGN|nr:hypothetical protein IFM89_011359 [Coptis chinensis]
MQPVIPTEVVERPKIKLLPRSKPLDTSEPPIVDYKQGYRPPSNPGHVETVIELHTSETEGKNMRGWKDLEVVETIYEEDHEDYTSNSPSLSPTLSPSPPTPLQSIAKTWSLATGIETDVVIHVQDKCFHLHKDPLVSKSGYLKQRLKDTNEITISPPLKITAETFSSIVDYCYTYQIIITPFNVAALRLAAELLHMTTTDGGKGDNNLLQKTESYFRQAVSVNKEYATIVLRSCLALLPEAESASMVSKCVEALTLTNDEANGFGEVNGWVDDIMSLTTDDFQMIAYSLQERFSENHDLLYRIVDLYIQEHTGKVTEEEKTRICNSVDCNRLSPHIIMHAVQNPRMPLRFIVRAMLVEQLNTRRTIICTTTSATNTRQSPHQPHNDEQTLTLGVILQRDAALRQVAVLKASMEVTSSKIESLEKDLMSMKKVLDSSKEKRESIESGRSASFRFSSERKVVKEEKGSHSISMRFSGRKERDGGFSSSSSSEISINESVGTKTEKSFGRKLMNGLKTALRMSSASSKQDSESMVSNKVDGNRLRDVEEDGGGVVVYKEDLPPHRRSRSYV